MMKSLLTACVLSLALAAFNGIASYTIKDHYYYQATGTHLPVPRHAQPAQPITIQRGSVAKLTCTEASCTPRDYKVNRTSLPRPKGTPKVSPHE